MPYNFTSFKDADMNLGNWQQALRDNSVEELLLEVIRVYQQIEGLLWENHIVKNRWHELYAIAQECKLDFICYKLTILAAKKAENDKSIISACKEYQRALKLANKMGLEDVIIESIIASINKLEYDYCQDIKANHIVELSGFEKSLSVQTDYAAFINNLAPDLLRVVYYKFIAIIDNKIAHFNSNKIEAIRALGELRIAILQKYNALPENPLALTPIWPEQQQKLKALRANITSEMDIATVNNHITNGFQELLEDMVKNCEAILGKAPCRYSLIWLGSMSRRMPLPYSDWECALLLEELPKEENTNKKDTIDSYFRDFWHLLHLQVANLGETDYGLHWDNVPYENSEKNDGNKIFTKTGLIKFIEARYLRDITNSNLGEAHSFLYGRLAYGDKALFAEAYHELKEWLDKPIDENLTNRQALAIRNLYYHTTVDYWKSLNVLAPKAGYLQPLMGWLTALSVYYDCMAETHAELLEKLIAKDILNKTFAKKIEFAFNKLIKIRLEAQLLAKGQEEDAVTDDIKPTLDWIQDNILNPIYGALLYCFIDLKDVPTSDYCKTLDKSFERLWQELILLNWQRFIQNPQPEDASILAFWKKLQVHMNRSRPDGMLLTEEMAKENWRQRMLRSTAFFLASDDDYRNIYKELITGFSNEEIFHFYGILQEVLPHDSHILESIANIPQQDGWRVGMVLAKNAFYNTLAKLFTNVDDPAHANNNPKIHILPQATLTNDNATNAISTEARGYPISATVKESLVLAGKLRPKPQDQDGRHTVLPIVIDDEKSLYCKINPEQPAIEQLLWDFSWRIAGGGIAQSLLCKLELQDKIMAGLMVEGMPQHSSLKDIAKDYPQILAKIDKGSFIKTLLRVLLTNPEDDKGDDYFLVPKTTLDGTISYILLRIDSERAFYAPYEIISTRLGIANKKLLTVKTLIYCLDQMQEPLDLNHEVIENFLSLDPLAVLASWIKEAQAIHKYYQNLFTEELVIAAANQQDINNVSLLTVALKQGLITELYQRLYALQSALRHAKDNNQPLTGLTLLAIVQPELAAYYMAAFARHPIDPQLPQARERFAWCKEKEGLQQPNHHMDITSSRAITFSLGLNNLPTANDIKDIYRGNKRSPEQAATEIQRLQIIDLTAIKEGLFTNSKEAFMQLQTLLIPQRIEVINAVLHDRRTKQNLNLDDKKNLLLAMIGIPWLKLNLAIFKEILTDAMLKQLLIAAKPHLLSLRLDGCNKLTPKSLKIIATCSQLDTLSLKGLAITKIANLSFPNLRQLDVSGCENLQTFKINAPNLKILKAKGCKELISSQANNQSFLQLQELDISDCEKLPVLAIDTPNLKILKAKHCKELKTLQTNSQNLSELDIRNCQNLTQQACSNIARLPYTINKLQAAASGLIEIAFLEQYPYLLTIPFRSINHQFLEIIDKCLAKLLDAYASQQPSGIVNLSLQQKIYQGLQAWLTDGYTADLLKLMQPNFWQKIITDSNGIGKVIEVAIMALWRSGLIAHTKIRLL